MATLLVKVLGFDILIQAKAVRHNQWTNHILLLALGHNQCSMLTLTKHERLWKGEKKPSSYAKVQTLAENRRSLPITKVSMLAEEGEDRHRSPNTFAVARPIERRKNPSPHSMNALLASEQRKIPLSFARNKSLYFVKKVSSPRPPSKGLALPHYTSRTTKLVNQVFFAKGNLASSSCKLFAFFFPGPCHHNLLFV